MMAVRETDTEIINILRTIVSLGHSLGMQVTAEGIEAKWHVALLKELGCDRLQGFYFGRPVPDTGVAGRLIRGLTETLAGAASGVVVAMPGAGSRAG